LNPMENQLPWLSEWPSAYRKLVLIFLIVIFFGFTSGLIYLSYSTHLTPKGVKVQYKGVDAETEAVTELKFEKSLPEMLTTTHNHLLGLSGMFLILGFLYLHTGRITSLKLIIAIEPLLSLLITFASIWIMRFLYEPFVYLVFLSGVLMVGSFYWMNLGTLFHLLTSPKK